MTRRDAVVQDAARAGARASIATAFFTILFALSGFLDAPNASYAVCLLLPLSYVVQCVSHRHVIPAEGALFAELAVVFAAMYCACICVVYYTQLTFVRLGKPSPDALSVVQYPPPSAFFAVDILAYTFLGISTLFVALSIEDSESRALKTALFVHFVQAIVGFAIPLTPMVWGPPKEDDGDDFNWMVPLYGWCLVFSICCGLHWQRFRRKVKWD
jgi:hypothetical protein